MSLDKKTRLLEDGKIFISEDLVLPCFPGRSTAGPDAGIRTIAVEFSNSRAKLELSNDSSSVFHLVQIKGHFGIEKNGETFIENIVILPTLAHAPNHAFINLSNICKYQCAFCALPTFETDMIKEMTPERAVRIFEIASRASIFEGVAITSGIPVSATETNLQIAEIVKYTREIMGAIPIGVEAYFEELDEIQLLKDAGTDEIKINIEVWDEDLFSKICPNRDRKNTQDALETAVGIFGKSKVTSNIIIGFGETDEDVLAGVEELARMGVVANIRALRLSSMNETRLTNILGHEPETVTSHRRSELGEKHRQILERYGLTTLDFKTMCFSCQCCDVVPFRDL